MNWDTYKMPRPLQVFLCHASQDKPAVRELYQRLKAEDWIDPWLDKVSILPGKNWRTVIEKAVEDSDVALICLSNQAVSKEGFVQREFKYAYDIALEKPEGTIYLIPLRLDDCIVPRGLRSFQYVNYFDNNKEDAYLDLLRSLKERHEQVILQEEEDLKLKSIEEENKREINEAIRQQVVQQALLEQKELFDRLFPLIRKLGVIGMILVGVLGVLFAGNYIFNNLPVGENPITTPSATLQVSTPITTKISEDGMALIFVPAGEFTMGSDVKSDERPIHIVNLRGFWIDQTEVTNAMYAQCVNANQCDPPTDTNSYSRAEYFGDSKFANYPVIYVNWDMAKIYCEWTGRRLPSEAEWEKAARGTNGNTYPWGDAGIQNNFLNSGNSVGDTTSVGNYPKGASIYSALDMAGNVWEWVNDWYDPTYYQVAPFFNPLGPDTGQYRVIRGGSWGDTNSVMRSASRYWTSPISTYNYVGFRCAMNAE